MERNSLLSLIFLIFIGISWFSYGSDMEEDKNEEVKGKYYEGGVKGKSTGPESIEKSAEDLTENIYRIINTAYCFDLPGYIKTLGEEDRFNENRFNHAFSFFKKDKGYLIKHLSDDNFLYFSGKELVYKKINPTSFEGFLWDINFIKGSIYKITPLGKKGFLVIKKLKTDRPQGQNLISYELTIGQEEEDETNSLSSNSYFCNSLTSEWRLNPFYPSSGYSDFFKIIQDCAALLSLKHQTKIKAIKTTPTSSHDLSGLSVQCLDKTTICLNSHSSHYKPSIREIFSIEDVFESELRERSSASTVKITRVIETEEVFQTTIENSLSTVRREIKGKNEKSIKNTAEEEGKELEEMDQRGFSQSLNTLLSIAVTKALDISNTMGQRHSKTRGNSIHQSRYEEGGSSSSAGTLKEVNVSHSEETQEGTSSSHTAGGGVKVGMPGLGGIL